MLGDDVRRRFETRGVVSDRFGLAFRLGLRYRGRRLRWLKPEPSQPQTPVVKTEPEGEPKAAHAPAHLVAAAHVVPEYVLDKARPRSAKATHGKKSATPHPLR